MTLQIEKVIPAGTNKFGMASDNSCVVRPPIGNSTARKLTINVAINPIRLKICKYSFFVMIQLNFFLIQIFNKYYIINHFQFIYWLFLKIIKKDDKIKILDKKFYIEIYNLKIQHIWIEFHLNGSIKR